MKKQQFLTKLAWLGLITSALIPSGCLSNPTNTLITQTYPESGVDLSAYGWLGAAFAQPMLHETVEGAFDLSPDLHGQTFWEDNTFWFRPIQAFNQDTHYKAELIGSLQTAEGQQISVNLTWEFNIREPELIYFVREGDLGEIWRSAPDGSQNQQLSKTGGNVFDFAPDQSGSWIAFTAENESNGRDLWIMDRDGEKQHMLIDCQQDICSEPTWAMDQTWLAYSRQAHNEGTGGYQPSQIWKVAAQSGETIPLDQDYPIFGYSPSFSPDGEKLAIYDSTHQAIRIFDLQTSEEALISRTLPGSVSWSSDSSQIMFTDEVSAVMEPFIDLYVADLSTGEVTTAFSEATTDTDFGQPKWSPDGEWIAVSLRPVNAAVSKMLWVISLGGNRNIQITDDQSATFSAYQWNPWGSILVYQRLALGSSEPQVSIWVWDWQTQESTMIVENASRPAWLP